MSLLILLLLVEVLVVGAVVEYLETAVLDQSRVHLLVQPRCRGVLQHLLISSWAGSLRPEEPLTLNLHAALGRRR